MRAVILGLLCAGSTATAQPANEEVDLQIAATGRVESVPDTITLTVPVPASGDTAAAAQAAQQARIARLRTALKGAGLPAEAVTLLPPMQSQMGFVGNEAYGDGVAMPPVQMPATRRTAQALVQIVVQRVDQVEAVRATLDKEDLALALPTKPALADDSRARAQAIAAALAQARRDAEAHAAPLGLKILRVRRVANVGDQRLGEWQVADAFMQQMLGRTSGMRVVTVANVWVDFVLGPR